MNKKSILFILFFLVSTFVFSQEKFVKWIVSKIENRTDSCTLTLTAVIVKDWYIYGMKSEDGGPLPLLINFENEKIKYLKVYEISKSLVKYDEVFNVNVEIFSAKAEFKMVFMPKKNVDTLSLIIDGQACNTNDGSCMAIYEKIKINLK